MMEPKIIDYSMYDDTFVIETDNGKTVVPWDKELDKIFFKKKSLRGKNNR